MRKVPGQGSNQSCSCRPTPQPQQRQIQAASATCTAARSGAGSSNPLSEARDRTHFLKDTSWILNPLSHNGNSSCLTQPLHCGSQRAEHMTEFQGLSREALLKVNDAFSRQIPQEVDSSRMLLWAPWRLSLGSCWVFSMLGGGGEARFSPPE